MSLPPLVCNTPPPPDQCEDDKDTDDFDVNYNLSQDEDEENNDYDYQTYTNYNMYEPSKSESIQERNWSPIITKTLESITNENITEKNTQRNEQQNEQQQDKLTIDDVAAEDLNLQINEDQLSKPNINSENSEMDNCENDFLSKEITTPFDNKTSIESDIVMQDDSTSRSNTPDDISSAIVTEHFDSNYDDVEVHCDEFNSNLESKNNGTEADQSFDELETKKELKDLEDSVETEDDFGDFDDFQFVGNNNHITTVIDNFEDPWNNETPQTSDFGPFKADFDDNINSSHEADTEIKNIKSNISLENQKNNDDNVQDDFGDFDDFKSCVEQIDTKDKVPQSKEQVTILDLHSPDNESQILESINNVFISIFEEEISEPQSQFIGSLESVLNEKWGHLVDTDVRQPYMVNWNNSLGQKNLLKALCIDSRNILFGPKWNYNMPKYAVNLNTAPLQPQKELTAPLSHSEIVNSDKSSLKETDTWTDPFSSNGQESCSNENESTTPEKTSTDLEVFEKVMSTKLDKVYPTSLNIQTLRQINLPDTHIFTPSDSETPRSKTIHYDSGPPILFPESNVSNNKTTTTVLNSQSLPNEIVNKLEDDNDYWEFQDFKSTTETIKSPTQSVVEKSNTELDRNNLLQSVSVPYQPHLLQPIKVEPIAPTLNWPDPGEVKETFNDFSDFVSSTPWDGNKNNVTVADIHENKSDVITVDSNIVNHSNKTSTFDAVSNETTFNVNKELNVNAVSYDDDFELFQSAPPPLRSNNEAPCSPSTSKTTDFDTAFSELSKHNNTIEVRTTKSSDISAKDALHFTPESCNVLSVQDGFVTNSPIHPVKTPNILQPLPACSNNTTRNQNNTVQILQPLSLESYSQINWPNPGIDLQDLSRFNPVETLPSLKSDLSTSSQSKTNSPAHNEKSSVRKEILDDDIWGEFVSSKPKQQIPAPKKLPVFGDEDEWTEFVSSPSVKPQNGLNTISLNVHTNLSMQKSTNVNKLNTKSNQISLDIPTLNYITPKSNRKTYNDKHFQNL
ncbi:unnamed protein product [Parnassius mnemosyne]|uniref:Aftiphilin clathrin-binding box domain-containing protein n=1 Tax=Parnassius mnemosyne TaxID=213953 RepID=A0AAV1KP59_9NEOP